MNFIKENDKTYLKEENGDIIALVDYPTTAEKVITITHTFVDDSLRGQGVAGKLMECVVEFAKENKVKIIPQCSYAVKWFEKNSQYSDLLK